MTCPTCNRTMQNIGLTSERKFWCPYCGTLKTYTGDFETIDKPSGYADKELVKPFLRACQAILVAMETPDNPTSLLKAGFLAHDAITNAKESLR